MDRLSKGLRASLSPAKVDQLQQHLADMAEEAQLKECVLRWKVEKLREDMAEAEQTIKVVGEENQRERERKKAPNGASRSDEEEKICVTLSLMKDEKTMLTEKMEMVRQNFVSLEKEYQRIVSLLETVLDYDQIVAEHIKVASENWARLGQERVDGTLSAALTAATIKQKWLKDLEGQAEKWMVVSDGPAQEVSDTNDGGLQCLSCSSQKAEQIIVRNQTLQGKISAKSERKMARLMAVAAKKEEKIRAAELKKRRQLEEKTRKELEKVNKAELKKKKRREAKEKKEAEKLERKRAKEERAETRQPRCCFCCFC